MESVRDLLLWAHGGADFDKDHMPTVEQVNDVMDGLVMLDAHIQA